MNKAISILLFLMTSCGALNAFSQRSNFSDWNVPPPIPPETIPRGESTGVTIHTKITIFPPGDIKPPALPKFTTVTLGELGAVLNVPPPVNAPGQPLFPATPYDAITIPAVQAPEYLNLPNNFTKDEINLISIDVPSASVPDMPELPKKPDTASKSGVLGKYGNAGVTIPIIPSLLDKPAIDLPATDASDLSAWNVPPIPLNVNNTLTAEIGPEPVKIKTERTPAKRTKRGT